MQGFRGNVSPEPLPEDTVTIPRADYENLVQTAQNHADLCRCLLSAPITDIRIIEALNACLNAQAVAYPSTGPSQNLYNSDSNDFDSVSYASTPRTFNPRLFPFSPYIDSGAQHGIYPFPPPPRPSATSGNERTSGRSSHAEHNSFNIFDTDEEDETPSDAFDKTIRKPWPSFPQQPAALRAVRLVNIPEGTTYADIAAVIRGGLVYEFYITHNRPSRSTATITFVEVASAQAYFNHVHHNGLYVNNKRVSIRWLHRHQIINGHHSSRIAQGATRNIVLRKCRPSHTEASIREDLDHIYSLHVVNIEFRDGNCHIGTNSVANAMYARTCMTSRLEYKNSRIEWDVDECAQPLGQISGRPPQSAPSSVVHRRRLIGEMTNRFQLLASKEE